MEKLWRCPIRGGNWFLSTPSVRRATTIEQMIRCAGINFYPRPPRGGRPELHAGLVGLHEISIHALREEGDGAEMLVVASVRLFLSTPSARRATDRLTNLPRGEQNFYPCPPRGGRPLCRVAILSLVRFLSTPSARRATSAHQLNIYPTKDFYPRPPRGGRHAGRMALCRQVHISIHALREEGDNTAAFSMTTMSRFLSTPSARRATR